MKFSEFLTESNITSQEIIEWFRANAKGSDVRNLHWNTRDNSIHLSDDITIRNCEADIPYQFYSCPKYFTIENSKIADLCFSENGFVLGKLDIDTVQGMSKMSKFPGFVNSMRIRRCSDLEEITNLPKISGELTISKCTKLAKIDVIKGCTEFRLGSSAVKKLPVFEDSTVDYMTLAENALLKFDNEQNEIPSVTYLTLGTNFSSTCSLKNVGKVFPKLEYIEIVTEDAVKSHVLGLLKIPTFKGVDVHTVKTEWVEILNKYVGKGNDGIIDCQNELLDAGYDELAQL